MLSFQVFFIFLQHESDEQKKMLDRTKTIETLRSTRQYLGEHYGVHSMMLFGSLAKGQQHEDSDVDVCVDMVPNLFNRAGVKAYLEELLGCPVDVVRMREGMNPVFKQQVLKYGVRIYWEVTNGLWDLEEYDVDAEEVFSIIKNDLDPLKKAIDYFIKEVFE